MCKFTEDLVAHCPESPVISKVKVFVKIMIFNFFKYRFFSD